MKLKNWKNLKQYSVRTALLAAAALILVSPALSLDINESEPLQYYSGGDLDFEVGTAGEITAYGNATLNQNSIEDLNRLYGDSSGGNFFQDACSVDGQVVEGINSDGTYSCIDPSEDQGVENLSQTLEAGNVANQSIDMSSNGISGINSANFSGAVQIDSVDVNGSADIAIGKNSIANGYYAPVMDKSGNETALGYAAKAEARDGTAIGSGSVAGDSGADHEATAVGVESSATNDRTVAIGDSSVASSGSATAVGQSADASGNGATALGRAATADSLSAVALGKGSDSLANQAVAIGQAADVDTKYSIALGSNAGTDVTEGEGSVAIGYQAQAPNDYEATFGNLNGQELDVNVTGNLTVHGDVLDLKGGNISNYFGSACSGGDAAVGVYDNGSIECVSTEGFGTDDQSLTGYNNTDGVNDTIYIENGNNITMRDDVVDADADPTNELQNLSEVLVNGNVANQTIRFDNGISIGDSDTDASGGTGEIAIGTGAKAKSDPVGAATSAIAIGEGAKTGEGYSQMAIGDGAEITSNDRDAIAMGYSSEASNSQAIALGADAKSSGSHSVAIGGNSVGSDGAVSSGTDSISIGTDSSATSDHSVAIGTSSNAPNSYEATFGNLQGQELDVNVTGNLTVHGNGGIKMPNGVAVGSSSTSISGTDDTAIGRGAVADSTGAETAVGYQAEAGLGGVAVGASTNGRTGVAIGNGVDAGSKGTAIGKNSGGVGGTESVAVGSEASYDGLGQVALGHDSTVSAEGAVAIGYKSSASNNYEATFGNLGSEKLDVNVTGNLTVHGSGGLDMKSNQISNVQDPTSAQDAATKSYVDDNAGGETENLSQTLAAGNIANQSIDFGSDQDVVIGGGGSVSAISDNQVVIGKSAESSGYGSVAVGDTADAYQHSVAIGESTDSNTASVAVGDQADADGNNAIAIGGDEFAIGAQATGDNSIAIGSPDTTATANGAVAIGHNAQAPNNYEATFGNLGTEKLDLNVTGNATIHGSGGLDLKSGDITDGSSNTVYDQSNNYVPKERIETLTSSEIGSGAVTSSEIATSAVGTGLSGGGGTSLSVDWSSANDLGTGGDINDFSGANDLNSAGDVNHGLGATLDDGNSANQDIDMASNDINNIGDQNTDLAYDSNDNRMELNSKGNTDICIGDC